MAFVSPPYNIINVTDQTASRVLTTQYTNSTGRTMLVTVSCICSQNAATDNALFNAVANGASLAYAGLSGIGASAIKGIYLSLTFFVRPGSTYKVNTTLSGGGAITLDHWIECY